MRKISARMRNIMETWCNKNIFKAGEARLKETKAESEGWKSAGEELQIVLRLLKRMPAGGDRSPVPGSARLSWELRLDSEKGLLWLCLLVLCCLPFWELSGRLLERYSAENHKQAHRYCVWYGRAGLELGEKKNDRTTGLQDARLQDTQSGAQGGSPLVYSAGHTCCHLWRGHPAWISNDVILPSAENLVRQELVNPAWLSPK